MGKVKKIKKKTHKAISKRITKTKGGKKGGKITKRKSGQDHFNTRESGKITRNKRRDESVSKADQRNIARVT